MGINNQTEVVRYQYCPVDCEAKPGDDQLRRKNVQDSWQ